MANPHLFQDLLPLAELDLGLRAAGYHTDYSPPGEFENTAYEQIIVSLFQDRQGEDYLLRILDLNQLLAAARKTAQIEAVPERALTLGFSLEFPYAVTAEQLPELAWLALVLNRYTRLGAFGVHPADGLYYRYSWASAGQRPELALVAEILEDMTTFASRYGHWFAQSLDGSHSLLEICAAIAETFGPDQEAPDHV